MVNPCLIDGEGYIVNWVINDGSVSLNDICLIDDGIDHESSTISSCSFLFELIVAVNSHTNRTVHV